MARILSVRISASGLVESSCIKATPFGSVSHWHKRSESNGSSEEASSQEARSDEARGEEANRRKEEGDLVVSQNYVRK